MSVQEIETAISELSWEEREQVRAWLDRNADEARERQPGESREERRERQLTAMIRKGREEFGPLQAGKRPSGLCAGQFTVPDDFDDPLPDEVLRDFEGGG